MWKQAEGRGYVRAIHGEALVLSLMTAFVARLSGLREIVQRMSARLGTNNFSSLSHALARSSTLRFAQALIEHLQPLHTPREDELVALDSMAVTLPITQRHRCAKFSRNSAGGGVLWEFRLQAVSGTCPVRILRTMAGAWLDASLMKGVQLLAHGPVYLMDRGFYALGLIHNWREKGVRFIMRARHNLVYEIVGAQAKPRAYGKNGWIELDAVVRLGCAHANNHPFARLIRARVGRDHFSLVTTEMGWTAAQVLDAYKKRERIERFHRFVKDTVGMAHLYNFSHTGIMVMLHVALLVALLLFLGEHKSAQELETLGIMRLAYNRTRAALGLGIPWKRNTNARKRDPNWRKATWQLQQNP